jgi:hypothetical protein
VKMLMAVGYHEAQGIGTDERLSACQRRSLFHGVNYSAYSERIASIEKLHESIQLNKNFYKTSRA